MEQMEIRSRLKEKAVRAAKSGREAFTCFLTPPEMALARAEARSAQVEASFSGGYEGAERQLACFHACPMEQPFPLAWVEASWDSRYNTLTHRDLLGSLLSLGMERERFGDIAVQEGKAFLVMLPEAAALVLSQLSQAGRTPLHLRLLDDAPVIAQPEGKTVNDTVASPRLDAVLSSALHLSRTKAAEVIRQKRVKVNHLETEKSDLLLSVQDVISVRGFGRVCVQDIGTPTKKGRLPITLLLFGEAK